MSKNFTVKYKNEILGTIDVNNYTFNPNDRCDRRFLPRQLRQSRATKKDVLEFLESRIVQRDNQGIRGIVRSLGLDSYNPISIISKTKGMDLNDCIWVTSNPSEDYYDVHIRENPDKYVKKIGL